ncbi:MAG: hypothetical protein HKN12_06430 [Gemmatimonadetes bacterium]|nr:hypothetical protein [Gemmatimonadota bacterium]
MTLATHFVARSGAARRPAAPGRNFVVACLCLAIAAPAHATLFWGPEANLSGSPSNTETGLNHHPMARTADGALHVVWAEQDAPNLNFRITTRRLLHGTWTPSEVIVDYLATDPGSTGGAKYPALAALPDGSLDLFWHDYRVAGIANVELFTKTRPPGGPWEPARTADVRLTTTNHPETNGDNSYVPVPVAADDGATHVVWFDYRYDGQFAEILSKSRPASGTWDLTPGDSADVRLTDDPENSELPDADVDAAGHVHAVWRSGSAGATVGYARRDAGTATWSAPVTVDLGAAVAGAPAVAVDDTGNVHVVWPDSRDGGKALWTRVRSPAGTWGAELRLTTPGHGADEPSLDCGPDGALHLVWHDGRVSLLAPQVFHRALTAGAAWDTTGTADTRVSLGSSPAVRPSVLADGDQVFVTWQDDRDGNPELYFRAAGPLGTDVPGLLPSPAAGTSGTLTAAPNPAATPVRFARTDGLPLGFLEVWDIGGRRVRRIASAAGTAAWDLRRDDGTRAAPGVYFVRAAATDTRRVTVLR